jgi:hypothetical protein
VVRFLVGGVDMRLAGVRVAGRGGGISGIGMMRSGRRAVDGGAKFRREERVLDTFSSLRRISPTLRLIPRVLTIIRAGNE